MHASMVRTVQFGTKLMHATMKPGLTKLNSQAGVHNAKAAHIGNRNIKIKIGGGGLPRNLLLLL